MLITCSRRAAIVGLLLSGYPASAQLWFLKLADFKAWVGFLAAGITIYQLFFPQHSGAGDQCPVHRARAADIAGEVNYISALIEDLFGSERTYRASLLYRYADTPDDFHWMRLKDSMFVLSDRVERLCLWAERVLVHRMVPHELLRVRSTLAELSFWSRMLFIDQGTGRLSPSDARELAAPLEPVAMNLRTQAWRAQLAADGYLARVSPPGVCM